MQDATVIVIGAGAAGLAAARTAAAQSVSVLVVEARDRIGGRVWTRPIAGSATPAELGAEFIHGRAKRTMMLLGDAGTAPIAARGDARGRARTVRGHGAAMGRCSNVSTMNASRPALLRRDCLRSLLIDRFDVDRDLDLVADHDAAANHRVVPTDAEVVAVDLGARFETGS